jgi:outer membrane protein OmpA-like peptidoglycan-associated protein
MKRFFVLLLVLAVVFMTFFAITACVTPPPPPTETEEAPPPPPPPPPPPVVQEIIDMTAPTLSVSLSPQPFSPDGDGENDELVASITIQTKSPIKNWQIQIFEPRTSDVIFSEWSDEGTTTEELISELLGTDGVNTAIKLAELVSGNPFTLDVAWDGISESGELVQSAMDYPYTLTVSNIYGAESSFSGTIEVGILVVRDGNIRRISVPSIVFAANTGSFNGLEAETMDANDLILRRVAEALERYPNHKVKVEGHANPTTAPGTNARTEEETGTRTVIGLKPLSEERAKAVLEYLVGLGIDRRRLSSIGMGGTRTVIDFADRVNWWKNRRVEFILED